MEAARFSKTSVCDITSLESSATSLWELPTSHHDGLLRLFEECSLIPRNCIILRVITIFKVNVFHPEAFIRIYRIKDIIYTVLHEQGYMFQLS
jgi:hypothetical protein